MKKWNNRHLGFYIVLLLCSLCTFGGSGIKTLADSPASDAEAPEEASEPENEDAMIAGKEEQMKKMQDEGCLLLKGKRLSSSRVKLFWENGGQDFLYKIYRRVDSGEGYGDVSCIASTEENSFTVSKLSTKKTYKFYIKVYYQWLERDGEQSVKKSIFLEKSLPLVLTTGSDHFMDIKTVSAKRSRVKLMKGRMHSVRCKVQLNSGERIYKKPKLYYYSTDASVAKADSNGEVTALKKGKAVIFIVAPNGVYDKVYVTVKA
ncbi:MAG: Ig-like domain-containing protein [Lachnospiraceae bacterium]|nr:Ig-like domain-containing protein [Lachnospiraceae bacterium]